MVLLVAECLADGGRLLIVARPDEDAHLLESVAMSDACDEYGLQPTVFYRWQKQLFEQGAVVFQHTRDAEMTRLKREVARMEEKRAKKNEVLGEE